MLIGRKRPGDEEGKRAARIADVPHIQAVNAKTVHKYDALTLSFAHEGPLCRRLLDGAQCPRPAECEARFLRPIIRTYCVHERSEMNNRAINTIGVKKLAAHILYRMFSSGKCARSMHSPLSSARHLRVCTT